MVQLRNSTPESFLMFAAISILIKQKTLKSYKTNWRQRAACFKQQRQTDTGLTFF